MTRTDIVPVGQRGEVVTAGDRSPAIPEQVRALQEMTASDFSRFVRRFLFLWFRVFVYEHKDSGKDERVDVRIPIPIPVVGVLFPRMIGWRHALAALTAGRDAQGAEGMRTYLDSVMGLEIVRAEERKPGKYELVVVGFD